MNVGQPFDAANAHAFDQHLENHLGFRQGQPHFIKRALVSFRETLAALVTTKALKRVAVLPSAFTFDPAIVASHCESP